MNAKMAAQAIRDQVGMDQILGLYGYKTKHGFMCCPFHGEKEPSLKVYTGSGGWHCFGCGRCGSAVDFVMEHENCDFKTAVIAIDKALHLGLMDPHEHPLAAGDTQRLQNALDRFVGAVNDCADTMIRQIEIRRRMWYQRLKKLEDVRDMDKQQLTASDWDFLLSSSILVDAFHGDESFRSALASADRILVFPVVYAEFMAGFDDTRRGRAAKDRFRSFPGPTSN